MLKLKSVNAWQAGKYENNRKALNIENINYSLG